MLGFGGFASFPGALMGVATGRPLVLHDANAVAGLANRDPRLRRRSHAAGLSRMRSAERHAQKVEWVGNPLRDDDRRCRPAGSSASPGARARCALLVVGGSLGARALNDARAGGAREAAPRRRARSSSIRRASATSTRCARPMRAAGVDAECVAFIDDMAARYAWADFVDLPRRRD